MDYGDALAEYVVALELGVEWEPSAAARVKTAPDPIVQLRQLGQLRDAGNLTEEEFTSEKAEILARL